VGQVQGGVALETRNVTGQTAQGKEGQYFALGAQEGLLRALEEEQTDELLPGGGTIGFEEDAVAIKDVFSRTGQILELGIPVDSQVFIEEVEQKGHAPGLAELAVEFLAAAEGVGFGQVCPFGSDGELPEDAIQQEAVRVGDGTGSARQGGVCFLMQALEQGLDVLPVAVVEEGRGRPHP